MRPVLSHVRIYLYRTNNHEFSSPVVKFCLYLLIVLVTFNTYTVMVRKTFVFGFIH